MSCGAKTIGVSVAIGEPFETVAEAVLQRWSKVHSNIQRGRLPYKVFGKSDYEAIRDGFSSHPAWIKPHLFDLLPEYDRIVYMDADTFTLRPWMHLIDPDAHISACIDPPEPQRRANRPNRRQFKPDWYFNAGLWVARRSPEMDSFTELWWALRKRKWDILIEQDPFNRTILDMGARLNVQVLPPECNHMVNCSGIPKPEDRPYVVHWAGVKPAVRDREMRLMALVP